MDLKLTPGDGIHINDFPNEVLLAIFKLALPIAPASLAEGMSAPAALSICRRWREILIDCLCEAPFFAPCVPELEMRIQGSWARREDRQDPLRLPKFVLQVERWPAPWSFSHPTSYWSSPPYQPAFEVMEELEVQLTKEYNRLDDGINSSLKFLEIKGPNVFKFARLHPNAFPHLTQLYMDKCRIFPEDFADILRSAPELKEFSFTLKGHLEYPYADDGHTRILESTSITSLSILFPTFTDLRARPWPIAASLPHLETFTGIAEKPFEKALPFASPSLRTMNAYTDGRCADRPSELFKFLEKCPQLEKFAIPTGFLLSSPFFDKLSSGAIVPNLKELRCGPSSMSADLLVWFLRKKGFVDDPQTLSLSDLAPVRALSRVIFCGVSEIYRKEIEEELGGVTNVVEFVAHEIPRKGRGGTR
ncbi:hypothetical protein BDN72DRAFT_840967, partial [Pluteus cervinus]